MFFYILKYVLIFSLAKTHRKLTGTCPTRGAGLPHSPELGSARSWSGPWHPRSPNLAGRVTTGESWRSVNMERCELLWDNMEFIWKAMGYYGLLWVIMGLYGLFWIIMGSYGLVVLTHDT